MPLRPALRNRAEPRTWQVLGSRTVFAAPPYVEVLRQTVALPDGRILDDYFRVHLGDYACVYPVTEDRRVLLLRQYSHGAGRIALSFPGGHLRPDEDPAEGVRRELLEETGHAPASVRPLARSVVDGNKRCAEAHLFLALGCRPVATPASGDLEKAELVRLRRSQLLAAAGRGEITALAHVALLALATHPRLGRPARARRLHPISE